MREPKTRDRYGGFTKPSRLRERGEKILSKTARRHSKRWCLKCASFLNLLTPEEEKELISSGDLVKEPVLKEVV